MKNVFLISILVVLISSCAQNDQVLEKLAAYNIESEFLTMNLRDADAEHFFKLKSTTINGDEKKVLVATFDPSKNIGERWMLDSIDFDEPAHEDLMEFDKVHNTKKQDVNGMIDNKSWHIEKEDDVYMVLGFKYDKRSLPKKFSFLGDCKGLAHYNKKTERLEKAEYVNEKPLIVKVFDVTRLDMVVHYDYFEEEDIYLIRKEQLDMDVKFFGQLIPINETNEYSRYRRIEISEGSSESF